jgi:ABC-type transport system substrate-binding protein
MPIKFAGWSADYADANDHVAAFLESWSTYAYFCGYYNASIDALAQAASEELNPTLREQMYSQISMLAYLDPPGICMYQMCQLHVERAFIQGYHYNPMYGRLYYADLSDNGPPIPEPTIIILAGVMMMIFLMVRRTKKKKSEGV